MYQRMLVPLDGSELAEVVFTYAKDLAGRLNLEVILLHVGGPVLRAERVRQFAVDAPLGPPQHGVPAVELWHLTG